MKNSTKQKLENIIKVCVRLVESTNKDLVMVYAAQAAYFVIISAIPFLCLLISIASYFIPTNVNDIFKGYAMPQELQGFIDIVMEQLLATQNVSLLSISAICALWTASRGSDAMRAGLENVYEVPISKKYVKQQVMSLLNTFILILVILGNVVLVLFGEVIADVLHLTAILGALEGFGEIIFFVIMCFIFAIIYTSTATHSKNEYIRSSLVNHLPGAVFATVGWMVFSYCYALYIRYFPSASAIYGSLTAVCLIMLWLYVCMVIMLLGAEVNKMVILKKAKE